MKAKSCQSAIDAAAATAAREAAQRRVDEAQTEAASHAAAAGMLDAHAAAAAAARGGVTALSAAKSKASLTAADMFPLLALRDALRDEEPPGLPSMSGSKPNSRAGTPNSPARPSSRGAAGGGLFGGSREKREAAAANAAANAAENRGTWRPPAESAAARALEVMPMMGIKVGTRGHPLGAFDSYS